MENLYQTPADSDTDYLRLAAWFIGPKGENREEFKQIVSKLIDLHCNWRQQYFPQDAPYITQTVKNTKEYKGEIKQIMEKVTTLSKDLQNSIPFFSSRYKGHMNWDISMVGLIAYFATMLYNPNNVATEASPVTTRLEQEVGKMLCNMFGFDKRSWGHITCDGSVANIEAVWAGRNLKYHAKAIQLAIKNDPRMQRFADETIAFGGAQRKLVELGDWAILNLRSDDVMGFLAQLVNRLPDVLSIVDEYTIQRTGLQHLPACQIFVPASCHYSWDKAAALLGLGTNNLRKISIDASGRMDMDHLRRNLEDCLAKKIPVSTVVAVVGTTAESAVDPVSSIVKIREEFRAKGLDFMIHADAAWGGYFATMKVEKWTLDEYVPCLALSEYVFDQLNALSNVDSITADPHKSGFIQYPAGSLCYRDGRIKSLLTFKAPVVSSLGEEQSMGLYGVEGSKPGAAVAATWLTFEILRQEGYAQLLGEGNFTTKMIYATLNCMQKENDPFKIATYQPMNNSDKLQIARILQKTNRDIRDSSEDLQLLRTIGPDLLINSFGINFSIPIFAVDGQTRKWNTSVADMNEFLVIVASELSAMRTFQEPEAESPGGEQIQKKKLFIIRNMFTEYHDQVAARMKQELSLDAQDTNKLYYLVNTNMDPWPTATGFLQTFERELRSTILRSIGAVTDKEDVHGFVAMPSKDGSIFGDHLPMFSMAPHQYHTIFKFDFINESEKNRFNRYLQNEKLVIFGNISEQNMRLYHFKDTKEISVDVFLGDPDRVPAVEGFKPKLRVSDVIRFEHFDPSAENPKEHKYFLYGDSTGVFMSHMIFKSPSFHQVVTLQSIPEKVSLGLLKQGIEVTILGSDGAKAEDPLDTANKISFVGENGEKVESSISVTNKIWFQRLH